MSGNNKNTYEIEKDNTNIKKILKKQKKKSKLCLYPLCKKRPCFGKEGSNLAEFCVTHKRPEDIDLKHKTCLFNVCRKIPSFGKEGSNLAEFCVTHKRPEDIDLKNKTCLFNGCNTIPCFGKEGSNLAEFCVTHKRPEDIDLKNKTCLFNGCKIQPYFGKEGSNLAEFCATHKRPEDIDLKHKTCLFNGCNTIPCFGKEGSNLAEFCVTHKRPEDIDLKHKRCIFPQCTKRPNFGLLFGEKTHCSKHKNHNEYKKNHPVCVENGDCKNMPCYTDQDNNYPLRCEDHKLKNDINVVERECQSCHLTYFLKQNGLCNDCHEYINNKVHKSKEVEIEQVLQAHGIVYNSWDKIPNNSCFKYRPDFIIDYGGFIIIIEVDEHAHRSYSCHCETVRMINIFQDFGGTPVIFVRYNPDNYTDQLGKLHKSSTKGRQSRLISTINSLNYIIPKICYP